MPEPPATVVDELAGVRAATAAAVPAKTPQNLLVASWNLRAFGGLTTSWAAAAADSPKRDWRAVALIAELVSCFDVVAIQEVKRNVAALRALLRRLGPGWRAIVSDVTEGDPGNQERLAFVYDTTRVQPSGLVGEIVLPLDDGEASRQFARSPYAASFTRGQTEFILTTVHVIWGDHAASRLPEITEFARWMRAWADRTTDWNQNLLVLGDFNLDRIGDPLYEAFVSTGLWPPPALDSVPRTIFHDDSSAHFYDQVAWFSTPAGDSLLSGLDHTGRAGSVDFLPLVYAGLTRSEISWRISDHYPLWVEFQSH